MRPVVPLIALALSLPSVAALAADQGTEMLICTGSGLRTIRLDRDGRPIDRRRPDEATGCAHLWCEPRRQRASGSYPCGGSS